MKVSLGVAAPQRLSCSLWLWPVPAHAFPPTALLDSAVAPELRCQRLDLLQHLL
jgi:hypothetical protein